MSSARLRKQYKREYNMQKIKNAEKQLFQTYGKQIVHILRNQKRNDTSWLELEESSPDIGVSYVTDKHLETIQNIYLQFVGEYRNLEKNHNCKKNGRVHGSKKKIKSTLDTFKKCIQTLNIINKQYNDSSNSPKPQYVVNNIRKMNFVINTLD
tara:strand:+ start:302 stop:760 length:459 start_codon:yes stop_codon:yes gene_type:complete